MARTIIFDTETTGLSHQDGDRVIEIGAVEMIEGMLTGRTFHQFINPERDVPMEAYRVHRISTEMLQDKPVFAHPSVGPAFVEFVEGAHLVAHNAPFDLGFINAELERMDLPRLINTYTDTVPLARREFPGAPVSLDALCTRYGINNDEREVQGHGALLDAELLAKVYIELTGGAQGGFAFGRKGNGDGSDTGHTYQERSTPLVDLLTDEEKAAHEAFVAELGEDSLWVKLSKAS